MCSSALQQPVVRWAAVLLPAHKLPESSWWGILQAHLHCVGQRLAFQSSHNRSDPCVHCIDGNRAAGHVAKWILQRFQAQLQQLFNALAHHRASRHEVLIVPVCLELSERHNVFLGGQSKAIAEREAQLGQILRCHAVIKATAVPRNIKVNALSS